MARLTISSALLLSIAWFSGFAASADQAKAGSIPSELIGTWKLVSRSMGSEVRKATAGEERLLIITASHATRIVYQPKTRKLAGVVGGRIAVKDGKYIETIEWADESSRRGQDAPESVTFTYTLANDQLRLETGPLGQKYGEIWQRTSPE